MGGVTTNPLLQTVLIAATTKLAELQQLDTDHIVHQLDRPMPPSFRLKGAMERKLFARLPELFASEFD